MIYFLHCFILWHGLTRASGFPNLPQESRQLQHVAVGQNLQEKQKQILNDMPFTLRLILLKEIETSKQNQKDNNNDRVRHVNVQALVLPHARRDEEEVMNEEAENEDTNMKMKLFRLMYETVRDSDLKVKRAELIKRSYANSSAFEEGYLLGDIADKYNIMSDIWSTLKRLYHEWKPIEHINAYEQIANSAIDVGHIVDMIKGVEKRTLTENTNKPNGGGGGGENSKDKNNTGGETTTDKDYFEIPGK